MGIQKQKNCKKKVVVINMIRVYFKKLENGNLEITEKMLNDILSYMKRQDKEIEKYEERNQKAIEFIEKNSYSTFETHDDINFFILRLDECYDLLDILKGEETE